jgi:hypothetical protein
MRRLQISSLFLFLMSAQALPGADQTTVIKYIPASSGPWVVTLSLNADYPYGGMPGPPVVFSAADGFAFQVGDVLTIKYDSGLWCGGTYVSQGTCVDANGYRIYGPSDNHPLGTPAVYAPSKYMDPSSYPIYLMQLVGAFADSRGQIVGTPFKVGNGPINATIPAGAAQLQLGANLYDHTSARDYYTPLKASVSGTTMQSIGAMAQFGVGGGWKTTIVLENSASRAARARLNFFDDKGNALALPLTFAQTPTTDPVVAATLDQTLGAGAALTIVASSPESQQSKVGWAQLLSDGSVSGFAIFGYKSGSYDQEAVVPLETRSSGSYILWFENTDVLVVGVALANTSAQSVTVDATIRDESGSVIGTGTVSLPAQGHTSFMLPERFLQTARRRGTVEFHTATSGQISVLGLRFNPVSFTTVPVLAK